jgi:hypothetical protein
MPAPERKADNLADDRKATRDLIHDAKESALEGARVLERLRIATEQYRERMGYPPKKDA